MTEPRAYWDERYSDPAGIAHHSAQNQMISRDFLNAIEPDSPIHAALVQAGSVLEVGCGTGELAAAIRDSFRPRILVATDASAAAIEAARRLHPRVTFVCCPLEDCVDDDVDLVICSNTLEHFRKPHKALKILLGAGRQVLVIVPYRQPVTDGYNGEGGAGHVVKFSLGSFRRYRVVDSLIFKTNGWLYSISGEEPRQLAVLLEAKT